MTAHKLRK